MKHESDGEKELDARSELEEIAIQFIDIDSLDNFKEETAEPQTLMCRIDRNDNTEAFSR